MKLQFPQVFRSTTAPQLGSSASWGALQLPVATPQCWENPQGRCRCRIDFSIGSLVHLSPQCPFEAPLWWVWVRISSGKTWVCLVGIQFMYINKRLWVCKFCFVGYDGMLFSKLVGRNNKLEVSKGPSIIKFQHNYIICYSCSTYSMAESPQKFVAFNQAFFQRDHDSWHQFDGSQNSKVCGASSELMFKIAAIVFKERKIRRMGCFKFLEIPLQAITINSGILSRLTEVNDVQVHDLFKVCFPNVSNIWSYIFGWISWKFWMLRGCLHFCSPIGVPHDCDVYWVMLSLMFGWDGLRKTFFRLVGLMLYTVERWVQWALHQQVDFLSFWDGLFSGAMLNFQGVRSLRYKGDSL